MQLFSRLQKNISLKFNKFRGPKRMPIQQNSIVKSRQALNIKAQQIQPEFPNGQNFQQVISKAQQDLDITQPIVAPLPDSDRNRTGSVLAIILGGGAGSRLYPLTNKRAKPAVEIAGNYKLIDIPMSNCINSGIRKVYILTQFNSMSLNKHLNKTYNGLGGLRFGNDGFVETLAASQSPRDKTWFKGTADAVRQYAWLIDDIKNRNIETVVILSGDQLYRMDYMHFVEYHKKRKADITIASLPVGEDRAPDFGLMKVDENAQVLEFAEKPTGADLEKMLVDTAALGLTPSEAEIKPYLASMGIYVFNKQVLLDMLLNKYPTANDFGGEIIPQAQKQGYSVYSYLFNGYWEDIGTIKAFFEANLALARQPPEFEFYDPDFPVFTQPRTLPPAKITKCKMQDCIIAQGSVLEECEIENAILGLRSIVGKGCHIRDSMIMGNDHDEDTIKNGQIAMGIGAGSKIMNTIVDTNARIGKNVSLVNSGAIDEMQREDLGIYIRSGVMVVMEGATIPDGFVL